MSRAFVNAVASLSFIASILRDVKFTSSYCGWLGLLCVAARTRTRKSWNLLNRNERKINFSFRIHLSLNLLLVDVSFFTTTETQSWATQWEKKTVCIIFQLILPRIAALKNVQQWRNCREKYPKLNLKSLKSWRNETPPQTLKWKRKKKNIKRCNEYYSPSSPFILLSHRSWYLLWRSAPCSLNVHKSLPLNFLYEYF